MRAAPLALVALAGCTLITEFDTSRVVENDLALCSDGADNDDNGLTDCQDWGCLAQETCCTIPAVVLEDEFNDAACADDDCDAPGLNCPVSNPGVWTSWGSPPPMLCEGTLSPHKAEQCYDVGVYSTQTFALRPGLIATIGVVGAPEIRGRLTLGYTFQADIQGSVDPCDAIDTVLPSISVDLLADEGGARYVARFDQLEVGVSPLVTDAGRHEIQLAIGDDRLVRYRLDGETFAVSPQGQPIPNTVDPARMVLAGRGFTARVDDVRITAGTQCDAPGAWEPHPTFSILEPTLVETDWDGFALYSPALVRGNGGYILYYSGCHQRIGGCDPILAGIGTASAGSDLEFTRDDTCPIIGTTAVVCEDGLASGTPFDNRFNNIIDIALISVGGARVAYLSQLTDGPEIAPIDADDLTEMSDTAGLRAGAAGEWDSHEVCCATALTRNGTVELWYAGRDGPEQPWHIGRAVSLDGVAFVKDERNPVLRPGAAGDTDDRGVGEPSVVYDASRAMYRMWYTATGFFGTSSIGYAVSTDGARWFKFPGNPVLTAEDVGLLSITGPDVSLDEGRQLMLLTGASGDGRGTAIYGVVNRGEAFGGEPEQPDAN